MDADIEHIVVLVKDFYRLLDASVVVNLLQSCEAADTIVYVGHVITHLKFCKVMQTAFVLVLIAVFDAVAVVAVEDLVVGVEGYATVLVGETLVQRIVRHLYQAAFPLPFFRL